MSRIFTCLLSIVGLVAVFAAIETTARPDTRTLEPIELWSKYGGEEFTHRLCDEIAACNDTEQDCSQFAPGIVCRLQGKEREKVDVNDQACIDYTGNPNHLCDESGIGVCFRKWFCKTDEEEGCIRDENPNLPPSAPNNPADTEAPDLCEHPDPEE